MTPVPLQRTRRRYPRAAWPGSGGLAPTHTLRRSKTTPSRPAQTRRTYSRRARHATPSRYPPPMESTSAGTLVKVAGDGPELDGIVFDTPSRSKIVVAVVDPRRGPVFRTVHPRTLTERTGDGPDDRALRLLVRRTPPPVHGGARGGAGAGHGRPGHTRGAMHRTTGR